MEVGVQCHPARRRGSGAVKGQSIPEVAHDNRRTEEQVMKSPGKIKLFQALLQLQRITHGTQSAVTYNI